MANNNNPPTYAHAGFNKFFRRSIDSTQAETLSVAATQATGMSQEVNFDQSQTSGNLGSIIQVGSINIDGKNGKISVFEGANEVVRIGELDG